MYDWYVNIGFIIGLVVLLYSAKLVTPGLFTTLYSIDTAVLVQGDLAVSTIDLFTTNVVINVDTPDSALTVPTFTGYAAQALATVPAPLNDPILGGVSIYIPSHVFACTGAPASPVTLYGWKLKNTGGDLVAAGNFNTPITVDEIGDSVNLQVTLNFQAGAMVAQANVS